MSNSVIFLKNCLIQVLYHAVVFQKDGDKEQCEGSAVELTHVTGSWRQVPSCYSQTGHQGLWLKVLSLAKYRDLYLPNYPFS